MRSTDEKLLNERQAANYLNLSVGTLRNWRTDGKNKGPLFCKVGGYSVRYPMPELRSFVSDSMVVLAR